MPSRILEIIRETEKLLNEPPPSRILEIIRETVKI